MCKKGSSLVHARQLLHAYKFKYVYVYPRKRILYGLRRKFSCTVIYISRLAIGSKKSKAADGDGTT